MMRLIGIQVDECPKFLSPNPTEINHSIYFEKQNLRIPLLLSGVISFMPCKYPEMKDMEENDGILELTPNVDNWNPHDHVFQDQEEAMVDFGGKIKVSQPRNFIVSAVSSRSMDSDLLLDDINDECAIGSVRFMNGESSMDPDELARTWGISVEKARRTIRATTCLCNRNTKDITLTRRYPYNDRMVRYKHLDVNMFTDTMHASGRVGKSVRNYSHAQVFATSFGWVGVVLLEYERDMSQAYKQVFKEIGVPSKLIADGARSQTKGDAANECKKSGCTIVELERGTPSANRAERAISELKSDTKKDMAEAHSPIVLWCYCLERRASINSACAKDNIELNGSTPHSHLTGELTDISNICRFKWYEWVKFRRVGPTASYPFPSEQLGRCLGPARNRGNMMSQHVLIKNGSVLPIQTLRSLTPAEIENEKEKQMRDEFDKAIIKLYGDHNSPPENWIRRRRKQGDDDLPEDSMFIDSGESHKRDDPNTLSFPYEDNDGVEHVMPDADDIPDLDRMIGAEVVLPKDGTNRQTGKVIGRVLDENGKPIGDYNKDPLLDTRVYEVMFPDGEVNQYSSNLVAEAIWAECDADGRRYQILDDIINHEKLPDALEPNEAYENGSGTTNKYMKTTKGWRILVQWKDGQQSWIPLKDIKDTYPILVAEYAKSVGIEKKAAFRWWVPHVIRKKTHIISAINRRMAKKSHKFGIEVPSTVEEAYSLDKANNNSYWRDAIAKEMGNIKVAFRFLGDDENIPVGYAKLGLHLIFDVKMDLTRKARLVAEGHRTPTPEESTYAGVVTRESVRIALTYAALLGIDVWGADIQNAYLSAPTSEKFWVECGPEFGTELIGKRAIVTRALYGTKSAGRDFRNHLRDCMRHIGFEPCRADPDMWMRVSKMDNGVEYYEYSLLYVDDCLMISQHPEQALKQIGKYFPLKKGSVGPPSLYLGAKISKVDLPNGVSAWAWSASKYVQEAVRNLETILEKRGVKLRNNVNAPLSNDYRPEIDMTPVCNGEDAKLYLSLIGILRWIVELGRIDITCEVSLMSSCAAMPREGQLNQVFHIFSYLKTHHNSRLVFDPTYPNIDPNKFVKYNWREYYGNETEEVPSNCPRAVGKEFIITAYVDVDFAGDKLTRRSRSGFLVLLNGAPIYWFSKKQGSCETSTFGSEFIAMKQCCEYLKGLRIKLRQMGIPLNNPCFVYGDNQSVLWNTTIPDSVLKKKTSSVAYNFIREGVSMNAWRTGYIKTAENPADLLTKSLPYGINRKRKVKAILYDIYQDKD